MGPWEKRAIPRGTTYHPTIGCVETQSKDSSPPSFPGRQGIIYNGPPSTPYSDMHGEGCQSLPRSTMVPFYREVCSEAVCSFVHFWDASLVEVAKVSGMWAHHDKISMYLIYGSNTSIGGWSLHMKTYTIYVWHNTLISWTKLFKKALNFVVNFLPHIM